MLTPALELFTVDVTSTAVPDPTGTGKKSIPVLDNTYSRYEQRAPDLLRDSGKHNEFV